MTMAKKIKKIKARKTVLDKIAARLRTILRRRTTDVVAAGKELIKARKDHVPSGKWQGWLAENFDLDVRTAQNYSSAAEYVARKSETVSDFAKRVSNLAPTLLYDLAAGNYSEQQEAAILAAAAEGQRVNIRRATEICDELEAPNDDDVDETDAGDDGDQDAGDADAAAEANKILDGPPPAVPSPPEEDPALRDFDAAIGTLKRVMTSRPIAQFARTVHNSDDLGTVAHFIRAVISAPRID